MTGISPSTVRLTLRSCKTPLAFQQVTLHITVLHRVEGGACVKVG